MAKKRDKAKKRCCGKYLKTGRHCKGCPLLLTGEGRTAQDNKNRKKKDKEKEGKKKK